MDTIEVNLRTNRSVCRVSACSPQQRRLDTANPAARVRRQLPSIPAVPLTHEQPSPLYKVCRRTLRVLQCRYSYHTVFSGYMVTNLCEAQNVGLRALPYAASAAEPGESSTNEDHVMDSRCTLQGGEIPPLSLGIYCQQLHTLCQQSQTTSPAQKN